MQLCVISAILILSSLVSGRQCGTQLDQEEIAQAESEFNQVAHSSATYPPQSIPIQVHWHAIFKDWSEEGGYLTRQNADDQLDALNEGFKESPFRFELAGFQRIRNQTWFDDLNPFTWEGRRIAFEMKSRLRQGNEATLNIYSVGFTKLQAGLLGYSTMPSQYLKYTLVSDGVVVLYSTLPGGSMDSYNLGGTTIHEVGHWVGLYHTFQGFSCDGEGDYVSDTPVESSPATGCPVGRDSCPQPGLDPIHNYMDYTDDECYSEFTPGQIERMTRQMIHYRHVQR